MIFGLIGLGRMGQAVVHRLQSQGFDEILVWDKNAQRMGAAKQMGVMLADNAEEVAQKASMIMSLINDDAGAKSLYLGPQGLLQASVEGKLFIESSTLQPQTVRELSVRVQEMGAQLIGAPIMGTIPTVKAGLVFIPAGGRLQDIERAQPVLSALSMSVKHMGAVGSGHAIKLVSNLTMAAYIQSLSEGLAMGLGEGLEMEQMLEVLAMSPTANAWLKNKKNVLLGHSEETTLDINNLRKDMINVVACGSAVGVPMGLSSALVSNLSGAVAGGAGQEDIAHLPQFFIEKMVQNPA
jgi:3-hydroxyisobutyrate dehydrogenase-like beta-hydroxyacid dehydrogenase